MADSIGARLLQLIENLTGEPNHGRAATAVPDKAIDLLEHGAGWGYSQFNEILLLLQHDRICVELFQYLVDGTSDYQPTSAIKTVADLEEAVARFRALALLLYGNVKFAFKTFRSGAGELERWLEYLKPRPEKSFMDRHEPVQPIDHIDPSDTFFLGYLIEAELKERLKNSADREALALDARRQQMAERGRNNHAAYLVSDHLDVYVATSMRARHEYILVSEFCRSLFHHYRLEHLKLRWFDPTQAYCPERIDKGLAEALMLKRAKCTIYLVQESDTLGKDSELASTLAQGKPVVAYVPNADEQYVNRLVDLMRSAKERGEAEVLLDLLRLVQPTAAWELPRVRGWLSDSIQRDREVGTIRSMVVAAVKEQYDKRAATLRDQHLLGIQVNLETGVANGVLVVRSEDHCAEIVRRIVTSTLEFDVEEKSIAGKPYVLLRERISQCVFRVMTGDRELSNAFWNFYLESSN